MEKIIRKYLCLLFLLFNLLLEIHAQWEAEALLNWKRSLISSSSLLSWTLTNSTSSNPCDWTRIKCDGVGTIVEINLADSGLDGTLDRFDFSAFPNLTSLNLYFNMLVGRIPFGLGNATKLRLLYLSSSLIRSLYRLETSWNFKLFFFLSLVK